MCRHASSRVAFECSTMQLPAFPPAAAGGAAAPQTWQQTVVEEEEDVSLRFKQTEVTDFICLS